MCCKSKFLVTEDDKSHILKLYGLMNEADSTPESNQPKIITTKQMLASGFWSENPIKQNLSKFFSDLDSFLSSNKGNTYITTINLVGSESKIPNTNNESSKREPLPEKELSLRRLASIKKIIGDTFKKYKENGTLINDPSYTEKTISGPTEWVGQTFGTYKCEENESRNKCKVEFDKCKSTTCSGIAKKYQDEQYVEVSVNFIQVPSEVKCLYNAKITIWTEGKNEKHQCNHAKYAVFLNGVILPNDNRNIPPFSPHQNSSYKFYIDGPRYASMDNDGGYHDTNKSDKGGRRENTFTITPKWATYLISKSKNPSQLTLSLACLKGIEGPKDYQSGKDCHDDVVHYRYEPGEGTGGQTVKGTTKNISKDGVMVNVATIQVCGGG